MSAQQPKPAEDRGEPRQKVFRLGYAEAGGARFKVHLLDVSPGGARLHAGHAPEPGVRMTLTCSSIGTTGEVRWVDASRFGIRFDAPLARSDLEAIVKAG